MTATLLPLAVAVPLLAAAALMAIREPVWLRRTITLGSIASVLGFGAALVAATRDGAVLAHGVGLWPGGIAIPFAADMFSALMVVATALLTLVCTGFGMIAGEDDRHYFAPLVLVLLGGVAGALLTADLFNLFVWVEVMLLPAYVLMSMFGGKNRLAASRIYITFNLVASAVFLVGIAFLYGVAGRVNIADLAGAAADNTAVAAAVAVILVALGMKAAVVPMHGWLSRTYPETSPTIAAIFSGLHTKVAIYAIYRIYAVIYDGDQRFLVIALAVMCVTMVVGAACAAGEETMRANISFNMVSGIGYILLGVALFGPLGLAAGIFYLLHHMVVVGALFLSTGAVELRYGSQRLRELGGIARKEPLIAFAFVGSAMALAGIPPFSGFAGKFLILQASLAESAYLVAFVVVVASLLTLVSMAKIWNGVFWGPPGRVSEPADAAPDRHAEDAPSSEPGVEEGTERIRQRVHAKAGRPLTHISPLLAAPAVLLTVLSLGLGLGAQGLLVLTQQAADGLLDPSPYVEAVLEP